MTRTGPGGSAEELHRAGVEAVNTGRARLGGRLLDRAWAAADSEELRSAIEVSQAYVAMELGNAEEAERLCRAALAGGTLRDDARGVALCQLAMVQMRTGQITAALVSFDEGIALLGDDPAHLARALGNRGDVYLHQGRVSDAIADLSGAAALFASLEQPVEQAKARHNLGYARFLAGDLVGALRDMEQAYQVLAPLNVVMRAIGQQDRAEVLLAAGLVDEGTELLRQAAADYGARRLRQRQAEAELTLARSLSIADPVAALKIGQTARRRFDRLAADGWRARAAAVVLTAEVESDRASPVVVEAGHQLLPELEAQGLTAPAATVRLQLARVNVRRGEVEQARENLAPALDPRAPLSVRLLQRDVSAELSASLGELPEALAVLREALDELHVWQSSFGSLDLQTNVVGQGTRLGVRGLALAVESASDAVLFEWSERARMLASRIQPVRAPQDLETAADLAELRGEPAPAREAELRRRVRERAWQRRGSGEVADPVSLAGLQARLGPDTALVAYVVTAQHAVGLVVTDRGTHRHELVDRAGLNRVLGGLLPDLDMAATELPAALAGSVRAALASRVADLAARLVEPLLDDLGDRRVVLTPSGVLAGVPWTLLPGYAGRPVVVAQSATSWLARTAEPLRMRSAGFVAGPRVARAEAEVEAAAAVWHRAPVLLGGDATAAAVSDLAGRVDVLHVAAHGRHTAENPLFSGLELVDGTWFGYDIDQLDAVPDVVLLSACEVGRSSVRWGEELIGMTAAWLHAGVRCVIASSAAVNDEAAHDALVAVHHALARGVDPAAALAGAVPVVSTQTAPAPFVCFG